jgi:NADH dehydrogenase [ubiquinone] 1 alpha subcomplex assembly factor 7
MFRYVVRRGLSSKSTELSVDSSSLYRRPGPKVRDAGSASLENETELGKHLRQCIDVRGPLPLGMFMKECLTNAKFGYYTMASNGVFGSAGDFVTAPEISQMFGELLSMWCAGVWQQMGEPERFQIVELGPGRATLMCDMLRAAKSIPRFWRALARVHFVEISPTLRRVQRQTLVDAELMSDGAGDDDESALFRWHDRLSDVGMLEFKRPTPEERLSMPSAVSASAAAHVVVGDESGDGGRSLGDGPMLVVGQEFLDALPVHQFEMGERGWVERLVNVNESGRGPHHFEMVLSPSETIASRALIGPEMRRLSPIGTRVEICPEALAVAETVAHQLDKHGGAALFIDYGENETLGESLRGIKNHKLANPLQEPGFVDLSALVDFASFAHVAEAATAGNSIKAYGAIGQGTLLRNLGIDVRVATLLRNANKSQADAIIGAYKRLVDANQMGESYKAMALVNHRSLVDESEPPTAFPPKQDNRIQFRHSK